MTLRLQTHYHPAYASMVLSWSITEVIRYVFYACTLVGSEPYPLLWLRYTTFYLLYPTGASSEAALIFSTLPPFSNLSAWGLTDVFRLAMFCIWWPCECLHICLV
jgi:very-long-chain (3R)-3-hydroxyacyl-CoA dehydratase